MRRASPSCRGSSAIPRPKAEIRARLATLTGRGDHAFLVVEVQGVVAGWIGVRTELSLEGGGLRRDRRTDRR
jgi:hypothetical protein